MVFSQGWGTFAGLVRVQFSVLIRFICREKPFIFGATWQTETAFTYIFFWR